MLKIKTIFYSMLISFMLSSTLFSQWVNDPQVNKSLVTDLKTPINITTAEDKNGGTFLFWEDNRSTFQNEIIFSHFDVNGNVSFRSDGKPVTNLNGNKQFPVVSSCLSNSCVVLWRDFSRNKEKGNLFVQRVDSKGSLLWTNKGLQVTFNDVDTIKDYSLATDNSGNSYIAYIEKNFEDPKGSKIIVQKVSPEGILLFKNSFAIHQSSNIKSYTAIVADNKGGAAVFWLESMKYKSVLCTQHFDGKQNITWGKKPLSLSAENQNTISYSVRGTAPNSFYVAWQLQKTDKDIFHQFITLDATLKWGVSGKNITNQTGNQFNPQISSNDSTLILAWTNEFDDDENIFIQKFNAKGSGIWNDAGVPVIRLNGDQFAQKVVGDGKGGAVVSWIDRRVDSLKGNIYVQRVNKNGKLMWDSTGVVAASNYNTEKSYVSLNTDERGGAIVVFREKRKNKFGIYGQKVFNSGSYSSKISGPIVEILGDSIEVNWQSITESKGTYFEVEKSVSGNDWQVIGTVQAIINSNLNEYRFTDIPQEPGTIYYRITQHDPYGNVTSSNSARIDNLKSVEGFVVAQNVPNPFKDKTVIAFSLPYRCFVKLEIFDSRVTKVKEISEYFPAGKNEITILAEGLQPGIYFYRFDADEFKDVKKMVIVK